MENYLINFIVYTMAMVGFLILCLMVYKKTMPKNRCAKNNDELKIENALNISPRKTLFIIKAGNEKFLIAADAERTTFLSKLETTENVQNQLQEKIVTIPVEQDSFNINSSDIKNAKPIDYSEVLSSIRKNSNKKPVMRERLKKLSEPIIKD